MLCDSGADSKTIFPARTDFSPEGGPRAVARRSVTLFSGDLGHLRPVIREPGGGRRLVFRAGAHPERREPNPGVARRTPANESGPFPPGPDERLVDSFRVAMEFELEVNPFESLRASGIWTAGFFVVDVG